MKTWMMLAMVALLAMPMAADACPGKEGGKGHGGKGSYFQMMDSNKDGAVSAEEHAAHAAERFKVLDTDGDGKVTAEEHGAFMGKMREKHGGGKGYGKGDCPKGSKECPVNREDCPKGKDCPKSKECPLDSEKRGESK